jgi:patatin-like phospholipase/acyl hydrolase
MMYHAILLERLWLENPSMLARIDLFAGTSSGAITALLLAYGYTPSEVVAIYRKELPELVSAFPSWLEWRLLWPFHARYSEDHKQAMLLKYLGRARLCDLARPVLVTAFDVEGQPERTARANPVVLAANAPGRASEEPLYHWEPALFSNLPAHSRLAQLQDSSLSLVEVAMRATASPSYFPIYQV